MLASDDATNAKLRLRNADLASEMNVIMDAARPLPGKARAEFLAALAAELEGQRQLGPGIVHRICRDVQKRYFDPPDLGNVSKHD
jgi:hypothetical protein